MRYSLLLLISLCCAAASAQQNPTITIGRTEAHVGYVASLSEDSRRSYAAFEAALGPSIKLNGTIYTVVHVGYNDASDSQLIDILYERLVKVDNVDFLFSPFALGFDVLRYAEDQQIPMLNTGIFEAVNNPQNWTWVVSTSTSFARLGSACSQAFKQTPMKTYAALTDPTLAIFLSTYQQEFASLGYQPASADAVDNIPTEEQTDDVLDKLITKWKRINPDVFISASNTDSDQRLIGKMLLRKFHPPLTFFVVGASFYSFRSVGWQADNIVVSVDFEPSLNFTDELFGSSQAAADLWISTFNVSITETRNAVAGSMLYSALKAAGTKDKNAVMAQLRSFDKETLAGRITMDPYTLVAQRPTFCMQFSQDGKRLNPVKPSDRPTAVNLQYPALPVQYPPGFLPKKNSKRTVAIIAGICGSFGFVVIVVAVVLILLKMKYHLVFVPKEANKNEEWT